MKFTCTQENLAHGLSVVARIASKSTNLPILNNILVKAEQGGIELMATNLEIGVTTRIRGKVEEEGRCTIPARVFTEYIALLGKESVTVAQEGTTMIIQSGNAETKLRGLPAEDFPLIPSIEKQTHHSVEGTALRQAISQVIFAAASDDTRPEISGVYVRFVEKEVCLAATDSYRLTERRLALQEPAAAEVAFIMPVRALQELLRVIDAEGAPVSFYVTPNQVLCTYGDTELVSRLIDGQYPDYRQIIPQRHDTHARTATAELLQALRATSLFSRPGINDVALTLEREEQRIVLKAANTQVGENWRAVPAAVEGIDNTIVFNSRYVLDGLTSMESDEVTFSMTNSASPGVLQPVGNEQHLYIIMPIKQ